METFREHMSGKIKEIKKEIENIDLNVSQINLNKSNSHLNLFKRPNLPLIRQKMMEKEEISKMLDQIGNDDIFFNKDNLLTNIKIESLENTIIKKTIVSNDIDKSFISKKTNKSNPKSVKQINNNRQKNYNTQNRNKVDQLLIPNTLNSKHNTLELNCNKLSFYKNYPKKNISSYCSKKNSKSKISTNRSKNRNKNICLKNISQFINKPNYLRKNSKFSKKSNLMTPISSKSKFKKIVTNDSFHSSSKNSFVNNNIYNNNDISKNHNDSTLNTINISISPYTRGRSVPNIRKSKNSNYLHFPNKSVIKKQEKILVELQKLFGEKIRLDENTYQKMTDLDKKNCINFLLEIIKEMNNVNRMNKVKNDGYKQIINEKEKEIKKIKNEIKEIKKENIKLNKIIKNDNQIIKKLNQNLESLKLQLDKEKIINKNNNLQRDKSATKNNFSNMNTNKHRNENIINTKRYRILRQNKSQDKIKKTKGFINKRSKENSRDKKLKEKINNLKNDINQKNIYEKIDVNIIWKNIEENRTDVSPNSRISNYSKDQNDCNNYHILNE